MREEFDQILDRVFTPLHRWLARIEKRDAKRRGSMQCNCDKMQNHEFHTLKEEMDCDRALRAYERYRRTCNEYEEEQRWSQHVSRRSSFSTKRVSLEESKKSKSRLWHGKQNEER